MNDGRVRMESLELRIFREVALEKSITKAAEKMGYVQSNVTAHIHKGVRTFFWTFSCRYTDTFSIIYRTHGAERHLNSLSIIPLDITVEHVDELLYRNILPGPVIKHFILEAPEKTFACRVVWRASLLRHRPCQTRIFHPRDPTWPAIMASPIRVDNGMLVS